MAKKLKTLYAERSLDEVELKKRECTIKQYAEKLMEYKETYSAVHSTGKSVASLSFRTDYKPGVDPKFMECAPYSAGDSISSRECDIETQESTDIDS